MFLTSRNLMRAQNRITLTRALSNRASNILSKLGLNSDGEIHGVYDGRWHGSGEVVASTCPTTGEELARIRTASAPELGELVERAREAYHIFRNVPAPKRGEVVRQIREALAAKREALGALVTLEMGKIRAEGVGEVQEFIDICDYAIGLSRMMNGRVIASERPEHSILEGMKEHPETDELFVNVWDWLVPNPLGIVAVLSAFNFPVAVYGWNLALSMVAGNATIWKPSPTTPLCSIAVTKIISGILEANGLPGAVACLVSGGQEIGEALVNNPDIELVSFTGSERVGRIVGQAVMSRFGKTILELGGNNASIVMPDANMSLAIPAVGFGAIGTAGQRCTSTRRLYLHRSAASEFLERLQKFYQSVKPGDPLDQKTLLGPLHTRAACEIYSNTIKHLKKVGSEILVGGKQFDHVPFDVGNFVEPTISVFKSIDVSDTIWTTEVFAPILNVGIFDELDQAIKWNNAVPQGLSSSLWTRDIRNVGKWIGPGGSDTGIVNVNVGTSGAEIGAAFGGNKSTGWGRESGGDAWKQYVRWSACTLNFSDQAPLAQGIKFSA